MSKAQLTYLVTGGAGFIGTNFIYEILENYDHISIINLDKLTYAGNKKNLTAVENDPRYRFVHGDIGDRKLVADILSQHVDVIVNFAAETHVDRSILDPTAFIKTDILGTYTLLEAAKDKGIDRFIQISTDEVYGSIAEGSATEKFPLMPTNPYSASKSGADRLAFSYWATYKVPVIITRCSNNYGPYQYPEKLIPLFVTNLIEGKKVPLYGDGKNIRDWIYVRDHAKAIQFVIENGQKGEVYNIAGSHEVENITIVRTLLELCGCNESSIQYVADRPGHDKRYSLNDKKLKSLGWKPEYSFEQALHRTVNWYQDHADWWKPLKSGEYLKYYQAQYAHRLTNT